MIIKRWSLIYKQRRFLSTNNDVSTAEYYFENGLRKVKPYYYNFHAFTKKRMLGQTVLNTFLTEYRGRSEDYYKYAIEKGLITVNDEQVNCETVLKHNDQITHKIHRHEPPVSDQPIRIVHEDNELIVIDKPGSIPVHPSGRYRHNTIVHIMTKEMGYNTLYPINRLDTMTSGLMLIAKSSERAGEVKKELRERTVEKEYICKVTGCFPSERTICEAPMKQLSFLVPLNYVHPTGKDCKTIFERLSYDGKTSLVRCKPLTGRTHQIRVHLRYLGFPIANDPVYGYSTPWSDFFPLGPLENPEEIVQSMIDCTPFDYMLDPFEKSDLPRCQECRVPIIQKDPVHQNLALWLHAVKYSGNKWTYESPLPAWTGNSLIQ